MSQETEGLNCYVCLSGTEGCGRPFKKAGSGVSISDSDPTFCTVCIFKSRLSDSVCICRKWCLPVIIMPLNVVIL